MLPVKRIYLVTIDGVIACTDIRIVSKFSCNGMYKYVFTSSNCSLAYCFTPNNRAANALKWVIRIPSSTIISPLVVHFWLKCTITIASNMSITHARSASMIGPISLWFSSIFRKRLVGIPWVILGSRLFALVPQQPYSVVVHANTLLKFLQLWKQQSSTFVRMRFLQNHTQNDRVKRTFSLVVFLPFLLLVQGITKVYSNNKCLVTYHSVVNRRLTREHQIIMVVLASLVLSSLASNFVRGIGALARLIICRVPRIYVEFYTRTPAGFTIHIFPA